MVRSILIGLGTLAVQGKPSAFAYTHVLHHKHADHDDDPHSPRHGFMHAHMGWFVYHEPAPERVQRWQKDPIVAHFDKWWGWWSLLGSVVPFVVVAPTRAEPVVPRPSRAWAPT